MLKISPLVLSTKNDAANTQKVKIGEETFDGPAQLKNKVYQTIKKYMAKLKHESDKIKINDKHTVSFLLNVLKEHPDSQQKL